MRSPWRSATTARESPTFAMYAVRPRSNSVMAVVPDIESSISGALRGVGEREAGLGHTEGSVPNSTGVRERGQQRYVAARG
jgi:hypothetical protein